MSIVSYRKTLLSEVVDFLGKFSPPYQLLLQSVIPSIVSQLLFYREEGKFLYPEVFIIDDESALKVLPGFHVYKISEGKADMETASKAIKKCAPLCERMWSIFLLISTDKIEYGLFSCNDSISSVSREDMILSDKEPLAISISILRDRLISVKTKGARLDVLFDITEEESVEKLENKQSTFFNYTIKRLSGTNNTEPLTIFLRRLFTHVFRHGHGTLACVVDADTRIGDVFKDGIILPTPVEFSSDILNSSDYNSIILEGEFELMSGMLQSDGITVFSDDGKVLAYNVFVEFTEEKDALGEVVAGGARSRAYRSLCAIDAVVAAYMQSQDGRIQCYERDCK